ncbi:hypothetical protein EJ04DRAFT_481728 [Polyplosphaeria fusca]|uniref:Metallo-beta-lactamase domain-containing protein n=1 Tax=Polyplosphaeria fusca TaxID=682080 RepID=A0A9P4V9J1_9PLEO|nr:hypothetical protein EJ04DRAFT_481728 [Polyplosphaeria fusca]
MTDGPSSAEELLDNAILALGGEETLSKLMGVTYHSPNIYRSNSLMQSYEMAQADTAVAIRGHQNVSFSFASNTLEQRIDRVLDPSGYWIWGSPKLDPFDFSLVTRDGSKDGFACFVRGNNQIWLPSNISSGYTDSALAEYLVLHGEMLSPKLTLKMKSNSASISVVSIALNGIQMPAVHDSSLDLTLILDPKTYIPHIVRTAETHEIYGPCTYDMYLTNYRVVDGLMFPHQITNVYNSSATNLNAALENYIIEEITTNPSFASDFFSGIPANESWFPPAPPRKVKGVTHGHLTEFFGNGLWSGINTDTLKDLQVERPFPGLPNVYWVLLKNDTLGVKQFIMEFENEVVVGDAPPQWTSNVIEWIQQNLKKPITHIWPTHHHRDHSGGASQYIALGAKLIVPEMAVQYWSNLPNATFITFNETHPYMHSDTSMQASFRWQPSAVHALDWTYAFVAPSCITSNSSVALLEADVWQAGLPREQSYEAPMRLWLDQLLRDGVTDRAVVAPTHGVVTPLTELIDITGYPYPEVSPTSWRYGNGTCST